MFIAYLLKSKEIEDIYTETLSGNSRMIKLAEKCYFEELGREIQTRKVRDKLYDGLTFKLNMELFWNNYKDKRYKIDSTTYI